MQVTVPIVVHRHIQYRPYWVDICEIGSEQASGHCAAYTGSSNVVLAADASSSAIEIG
jgi:hypothetical protein